MQSSSGQRHSVPLIDIQQPWPSALDVRQWLDGQSVSAYRESAFEQIARTFRQHQTAVFLVITYLVVRSVILLWRHI